MAFDINALAIHKVLRGSLYHSSTGAQLWSVTQVKDFSLSVTTDELTISDFEGAPIMKFDRAKTCTIKGTNAIFDLGLMAAQSGTSKVLSSATSFSAYANEVITIPTSGTTVTLSHTPAAAAATGIPYIYKLRGDSGTSTSYAYAASASGTQFTFTGTTLTFPTGLDVGTQLLVPYYYTADGSDEAVKVENNGVNFATPGRFVLEFLAHDPCDVSSLHYAMLIFPNAKLSSAFDLSIGSDSGHPFSLEAMQDYCDADKLLFTIIVPEDQA